MLYTRLILFIDDDPRLIRPLLEPLGEACPHWSIVAMDDVETALAYAAEARLDAIFLNLHPCGVDGLEVLACLGRMESTRGAPAVVFAETFSECDKARAIDLGAADVMTAPITFEDLRVRVRNVLAMKSLQEEMAFLADCVESRVRRRTGQLEVARLDALWRLAKACEYRDSETGDHVLRVGHGCRILAETMGFPREFVETVFATSPLHDIGKIGIPDAILLKAGPLSEEEFGVMARHCAIGANILVDAPKDASFVYFQFRGRRISSIAAECNEIKSMASAIALNHHEWFDGTGYPNRLAGDAIPIEARIVAIIDVYDALRSVRPYKPAYPHADAVEIIRSETPAHFDPAVAAAFERSIEHVREVFTALSIEEAEETESSKTSAA